jgi:hypothetical protein
MAGKGNVDPGYIPKTARVVFNNDINGSITFTQVKAQGDVQSSPSLPGPPSYAGSFSAGELDSASGGGC